MDLPIMVVPESEDEEGMEILASPTSSSTAATDDDEVFQGTSSMMTPSKSLAATTTATTMDDENAAAIVTPDSVNSKDRDSDSPVSSLESGDTCSETSVASSNHNVAMDIVFGKPKQARPKKEVAEVFDEQQEEEEADDAEEESGQGEEAPVEEAAEAEATGKAEEDAGAQELVMPPQEEVEEEEEATVPPPQQAEEKEEATVEVENAAPVPDDVEDKTKEDPPEQREKKEPEGDRAEPEPESPEKEEEPQKPLGEAPAAGTLKPQAVEGTTLSDAQPRKAEEPKKEEADEPTTAGEAKVAETPSNNSDYNDNNEASTKQDEKPPRLQVTTTPTVLDALPSPPLRTNRVSITAAHFDRPSPITTPRRTSAVGTGLSELSKQLRVLQAKNKHLQSEMERCQRQLKIMSESKGVSVVDVLASLESACAREAHAELQSQIASLQAQLEALKLGKSPDRSGSSGAVTISKAAELKQESLKQQIASLQLQVGEHEELEAKYKEETKTLYAQVQKHQTKATTLEATCAQQTTLLDLERARTTDLEAEVRALREERDVLKEKQTKRMAEFWQQTLHKSWSVDENDYLMDNAMGLYYSDSKNSKEDVARALVEGTSDKPTYFKPSRLPLSSSGDNETAENQGDTANVVKSTEYSASAGGRPTLSRTYSDPALWSQDPDMKASMPKAFVASMIPKYSPKYKQWNYMNDVADNTHRAKLYVKQSAKNMELEVLCRHQQQTIQDLQNDQSRDTAKFDRLIQERNAAEARRNICEDAVQKLELNYKLECDQTESLREQLRRREEEFSLKKDQLSSRLQVHQDRIVDVEGQLSSLYVAYELLQEDREEEQQQQAELQSRLVDADTMLAKEISEKTKTADDTDFAREVSQQDFRALQDQDTSESSAMSVASSVRSSSDAAHLRKSAGLLTPSPKRQSRRSFFAKGNSSSSILGLPKSPPFASGSRRASTGVAGLPPTGPSKQRRSSTGSPAMSNAPPPPGTTICKGYLLHQQPRKKKLLRGEKSPAWKRKYVVLKRGDGPAGAGSYCMWYGDVPQGKVKGTVPHLIRGISKVSFGGSVTTDPDNHEHTFLLRINPSDPEAPVAHFAAFSSAELEPWKQVLQVALDVDFYTLSLEDQQRAQVLMAHASSRNYLM